MGGGLLTVCAITPYVPVLCRIERGGVGTVSLSAAVGLLTRNVKVMGADINAYTENYGATITVGALARGSTSLTGVVNMSYVQLHNCGQMNMEHVRALGVSFAVQHGGCRQYIKNTSHVCMVTVGLRWCLQC